MAVGNFLKDGGHIHGFRKELEERAQQKDSFFSFFANSKDTRDAFARGAWDFSLHIAPKLGAFLGDAQEKTVLEIGYGGGRLLAAASRHFKHAVGVDVHANSTLVRAELSELGIHNVTLYETDGQTIPVPNGSISAIYSFIVFQHMEKEAILRKNIEEAHRCLEAGGIGLFYFARVSRLSLRRASRVLAAIDVLLERLGMTAPYKEKKARVNETNLEISERHIRHLCQSTGFQVLDSGLSRRYLSSGRVQFGGQGWLLVKKDER